MLRMPEECPDEMQPAWGFLHEGRIMKWETFEKAFIATSVLGLSPYIIAPVVILYPEEK